MHAQGLVIAIFPTQRINDKFQKREFVIEYATNPKYPELVKFEAQNDRCESLDALNVGDMVHIDFALRGRKWTDKTGVVKYFTTLVALKVTPHDRPAEVPAQDADSGPATEQPAAETDNLPF